jgi:hypothetical protein
LASLLFPASPLAEIATLPFPQAANGEKPYREHHPTGMDILRADPRRLDSEALG